MYVQVSNFVFAYLIEYQTHVSDSNNCIFLTFVVQIESCNAGDADECKSGEAKIRKQKHDFAKLAFGNIQSLEARFVWYEFKRTKGRVDRNS